MRTDPVFAEPPSGKGGGNKPAGAERQDGKGKGKDRDRSDDRRRSGSDQRGEDQARRAAEASRSSSAVSLRFEDRHRTIVRDFYAGEYRSGHCPPGLAKKNNACMPPGQAKKWRRGQPLSRDVIFYEIPPELVIRIGVPPPGHRMAPDLTPRAASCFTATTDRLWDAHAKMPGLKRVFLAGS